MPHHIFELLRSAVVHYGYWAVAAVLLLESAGLPLPGESILLLASFLAYSQHELSLPWIIAVGTLAATLGGELGFALGRHGGRPLIDRYRDVFSIRAETLTKGEQLFNRYGGDGFSSAISLRDESSVCAPGWGSSHAVAKVHAVQFSRSRSLGDRNLQRRILVWRTLEPVGA